MRKFLTIAGYESSVAKGGSTVCSRPTGWNRFLYLGVVRGALNGGGGGEDLDLPPTTSSSPPKKSTQRNQKGKMNEKKTRRSTIKITTNKE